MKKILLAILAFSLLVGINSCSKENLSPNKATSFKVGDVGRGGGVVFMVDTVSKTYFEAAPSGWVGFGKNETLSDPQAAWGCPGSSISTFVNIDSGMYNTTNIVNGCVDTNTAATLCYNFEYNGKTDWFLPSKLELDILYQNRYLPGINLTLDNGSRYWSSTQIGIYQSYTERFDNGNQETNQNKGNLCFVRPIRRDTL